MSLLVGSKLFTNLNSVEASVGKSITRLTSGLRINSAADDPAGLGVASALRFHGRISAQGVRNVNDAISLVHIAEQAQEELTSILSRAKELAVQSSSASYSNAQRGAMDAEAQALREEFNRIVHSTKFNGLKLLDGSNSSVLVQAGVTAGSGLDIRVGVNAFGGYVNAGSFQAAVSYAGGQTPGITNADLNNDGYQDLVSATLSNTLLVNLGNGDGTFRTTQTFAAGNDTSVARLADLNGDGNVDAVTSATNGSGVVDVFLGNGDGSFKARVSYGAENNAVSSALYDINRDGRTDIVSVGYSLAPFATMSVLLGNGDGTFTARTSYVIGDTARYVSVADLNQDGYGDSIVAGDDQDRIYVLMGNSDGSFKAYVSYAAGDRVIDAKTFDFNRDGKLDIVTSSFEDDRVNILIGNGDGTFKGRVSYAGGDGSVSTSIADLNNDGYADLAVAAQNEDRVNILFGNGDGTFRAKISYAGGNGARSVIVGTFNSDGVLDIVTASFDDTRINVLLGDGTIGANLSTFSIATRSDALAAILTITEAGLRLDIERGKFGAQGSRLSHAANLLSTLRENFEAAEHRITDVDVAEETAQLVRSRIVQNAATAILAQANQSAAIVLQLLKSA